MVCEDPFAVGNADCYEIDDGLLVRKPDWDARGVRDRLMMAGDAPALQFGVRG